jgi:hypothetical protein
VLTAVLSTWVLAITGASGALVFGLAAATVSLAFAARNRPRRAALAVARGLLVAVVVWNAVSIAVYVRQDSGDPMSQRVATWGRDHGMGAAIDYLEARLYSTPPGTNPARSLRLEVPLSTRSSVPAGTPSTGPSPHTTTPGTTTPGTTIPSTTGPDAAAIPPPAPLVPLFSPALAGEGQWTPIASADGQPSMWVTGIRPLKTAGGVVGTMVVIDQTHTRAGLFNGSKEPGGTWQRGNKVPPELQPSLLAVMNGGFRLEHIKGGYVTEGRVVKPLRQGDATLAIGHDGKVVIGQLGRDIFDDGSWLSLRQNLVLIVDNGVSRVQAGIAAGVWWGADFGNRVYVPRSAVCKLRDGRLAYSLIGNVDAEQFAQSLIAIGCVKAMQLDINGTWPNFMDFIHHADGSLTPQLIDNRMGTNLRRYLDGSSKEFIAFFDARLVPAASVLDR